MFLVEQFQSINVRFLKAPNGEPVIIATDLIEALKGDKANTADLIKKNVRSKWWIDLPNPNGGRPVRCLFEPGAYQLAGNPAFQTEFAEQFQDWLFEKAIPKIRASGGYIMPTATSKQLKALEEAAKSQRQTIENLIDDNAKLVIENLELNLITDIRYTVDKFIQAYTAPCKGKETSVGSFWELYKEKHPDLPLHVDTLVKVAMSIYEPQNIGVTCDGLDFSNLIVCTKRTFKSFTKAQFEYRYEQLPKSVV